MFPLSMAKDPDKKLIKLPSNLWRYLEVDSNRCRRSVTKQIEAILVTYFQVENIEVNPEAVKAAQIENKLQLQSNEKTSVSEATINTEKATDIPIIQKKPIELKSGKASKGRDAA